MAAADHAKAVRTGEIAGGRQFGDGLLAGIDEIGIFLSLIGERSHAEHTVLALKLNAHAGRDIIGDKGGNTDAKIDVKTVLQFLCGPFGHLIACPGHLSSPRLLRQDADGSSVVQYVWRD